MDGELAVRLLVAALIAVVAIGVAMTSRRGTARRRRPFRPVGLEPGFTLFTSSTCTSCARARSALREAGMAFDEIAFEAAGEAFAQNGIERVPALVEVAVDGSAWVAYGVPDPRVVRRWSGP